MGILQARILEWIAMPSRVSSQPRDRTQVSYISGRLFTVWATRGVYEYWTGYPIPSPEELPDPESNQNRLHSRGILYQLSYQRSPYNSIQWHNNIIIHKTNIITFCNVMNSFFIYISHTDCVIFLLLMLILFFGVGNGNPLQNYYPGTPHGQSSLAGCRPWGSKELETPETVSRAHSLQATGRERRLVDWWLTRRLVGLLLYKKSWVKDL